MTEALPDRPSRHGRLLGEALAAIADAGRFPDAPALCATCAFRRGSMPNETAATGTMALNIVLGIDTDGFACHHGMKGGWPTKLCVGAILAKRAPFSMVQQQIAMLRRKLEEMFGDDEVRLAFDRWWDGIDPHKKMDVYELASAYAGAGEEHASFEIATAEQARALRAEIEAAEAARCLRK